MGRCFGGDQSAFCLVNLVLLDEAEEELVDAIARYERIEPGLGRSLRDEVTSNFGVDSSESRTATTATAGLSPGESAHLSLLHFVCHPK